MTIDTGIASNDYEAALILLDRLARRCRTASTAQVTLAGKLPMIRAERAVEDSRRLLRDHYDALGDACAVALETETVEGQEP